MRHAILVSVSLLLLLPHSVDAQQVQIGSVHVGLDEPEDTVLARLEAASGLTVRHGCQEREGCRSWVAMRGDEQPFDGIAGSVVFRQGRVARAARYWEPMREDSPQATTRAIVGAIRSLLGQRGASVCVVSDHSGEGPRYTQSGINIECGDGRQVSVSTSTVAGYENMTVAEYVEDEQALEGGSR